jgi:hypothetical protein
LALAPLASISPAWAVDVASPSPKVVWSSINSAPQSWIRGVSNHLFECATTSTGAVIAMKDGNRWREISRASAQLDKKLCTDPNAPYVLKYQFTIESPSRGAGNFPGTRAGLVVFRIQNGGTVRMSSAALYASKDAADSDQLEGHAPEQDDEGLPPANPPTGTVPLTPNVTPSTGSATTPSGAAAPALSGAPTAPAAPQSKNILKSFPSCKFNNILLAGRAKVVSAGGQLKVRVVPGVADFGVRTTDRASSKCGEWRFVSSQADFTVEIVDSGEDFTISFSMRPGPR